MKGIVLAGGLGTRLRPLTFGVTKHLLAIFDKPLIYYPLSVLMLAGIRDILIIAMPRDIPAFCRVLGNGDDFGIHLSYAEQERPDGVAQALIVGADHIGAGNVALALGDNILFGQGLQAKLRSASNLTSGALIFGYRVPNPEQYGIVTFGERGQVLSVVEKPGNPASDWAVVGLYFYDNRVVEIARSIVPSARGELEISDVNACYLELDLLRVERLGRGYTWLDAGGVGSLIEAGEFVRTIQHRTGLQIACLEEIALNQSWLEREQVARRAEMMAGSGYGQYLKRISALSNQM